MQFDIQSTLAGFLVGVATGAAGSYFGNKYTDRRKEREAARRTQRQFADVKKKMPELIAEMKADLSTADGQHVREFFVLEKRSHRLGGSEKPRFCYYVEEHGDLHGKLSILGNHGYLIDVTPGNTPIYRMTEEFVELIHKCD